MFITGGTRRDLWESQRSEMSSGIRTHTITFRSAGAASHISQTSFYNSIPTGLGCDQ